ncbi:MAG: alpha/beta hydrolase [Alphaproteobacteria bacterium]
MTEDLAALKARRHKAMMQGSFRLCVMALLVYVILGVLLYTFQRSFLYPGTYLPPVGTPSQEGIKGLVDLRFPTADGLEGHAWYAPARDAGKPVILFLHGNGITIKSFYPKAKIYLDKGYGAFLCEYRGFGGRPGKPTEDGLYIDADACLAALKEQGHAAPEVVYLAESLGTGIAVNLSVKNPPRALILETPYSSVVDVAKLNYGWYPVDWMLEDKFDSISRIEKVKTRILIVHGNADGVIPFGEGKRLFDKAGQPKELHAIARGGHNDLYYYGAGDIITGWLDKLVKEDKAQ